MPQPTLLQLLVQLQTDLNALTVSCIEANSRVTDIIALYGDEVSPITVLHDRCAKWGVSLDALSDALEKFQDDSDRLVRYFDAQR